jgi:predicted TIM-barrel fold metal-dependent hydrolase
LLSETFRYVGEKHFVYATDIPHWDCEFPAICATSRSVSDETKNKLRYEKAKALYAI